ncbi:MAG TPA: hypothetical protein VM599_01020 [Thermoanaerobaculia bacterium]|nr:hypothetical protein [Thermoanaerobaculia bacterium]
MTPDPPAVPGPSRLEARYLESLPPLYYWLGALLMITGVLPLLGALTLALRLPETFSDSALDGMLSWPQTWLYLGLGMGVIHYGAGFVAAGFAVARRRRFGFCRVMAWLACLFFPFGTLTGAMTLLLLRRPRVRASFEDGIPQAARSIPE